MQVMFKVRSFHLWLDPRDIHSPARHVSFSQIGSRARPEFPPDITPEAEDFLEKTFMLDFAERPTAVDFLQHAFIKEDM